jgi:hypothetical protein
MDFIGIHPGIEYGSCNVFYRFHCGKKYHGIFAAGND